MRQFCQVRTTFSEGPSHHPTGHGGANPSKRGHCRRGKWGGRGREEGEHGSLAVKVKKRAKWLGRVAKTRSGEIGHAPKSHHFPRGSSLARPKGLPRRAHRAQALAQTFLRSLDTCSSQTSSSGRSDTAMAQQLHSNTQKQRLDDSKSYKSQVHLRHHRLASELRLLQPVQRLSSLLLYFHIVLGAHLPPRCEAQSRA